jgi:hypothetical protein
LVGAAWRGAVLAVCSRSLIKENGCFIFDYIKELIVFADEDGILAGTRFDLVENQVALIVPAGNPANVHSFDDAVAAKATLGADAARAVLDFLKTPYAAVFERVGFAIPK